MEDIISNTVQIVKRPHPAGWENTAILQFKIKITEILEEKLSNTAIPQTPMSPSFRVVFRKLDYSYHSQGCHTYTYKHTLYLILDLIKTNDKGMKHVHTL